MKLDLDSPRGKIEWYVFGLGIAGLMLFGILPEDFTGDFDLEPGLALTVSVSFWMTFLVVPCPLFRLDAAGVWAGRLALLGGTLSVAFAKGFFSALMVLLSAYLVAWAAIGPQRLFTPVVWRMMTSRRELQANCRALLAGERLPARRPSITIHQWIAGLYQICKDIERWRDPGALRSAVIEELESRECLAHYGELLNQDLQRAASEFVRALDTRNVKSAACEFVRVHRHHNCRNILRKERSI